MEGTAGPCFVKGFWIIATSFFIPFVLPNFAPWLWALFLLSEPVKIPEETAAAAGASFKHRWSMSQGAAIWRNWKLLPDSKIPIPSTCHSVFLKKKKMRYNWHCLKSFHVHSHAFQLTHCLLFPNVNSSGQEDTKSCHQFPVINCTEHCQLPAPRGHVTLPGTEAEPGDSTLPEIDSPKTPRLVP